MAVFLLSNQDVRPYLACLSHVAFLQRGSLSLLFLINFQKAFSGDLNRSALFPKWEESGGGGRIYNITPF